MNRLLFQLAVCLLACSQVSIAAVADERLASRYEEMLLFERSDYRANRVTTRVFNEILLNQFENAIDHAQAYPYALRGVPALYNEELLETRGTASEADREQDVDRRFLGLFSSTLPLLAYAYQTPGPGRGDNPYYQNRDVARLYGYLLEYCYSRGLTELAWMPDHAGTASERAQRKGLARTSGDFSAVSLHLGGFIQSIFLMREPLAEIGLLQKYRRVARNLVINNGTMYGAFFLHAREEAGINYPHPLPENRQYYLNADGMRLLADYFIPYFLLIEDAGERRDMEEVLKKVLAANIAIRPGVQGTIKPDGTGFHHGAAYIGAYSPFTFESFARLLYLLAGTDFYDQKNVAAVKLALQSFRVMVHKYTVPSALRGRLIEGDGDGASTAATRAMALLAHPDGVDDLEMRARFNEFFDPDYFFSKDRVEQYHAGRRGVPIRDLGIYRLIDDILDAKVAAEAPTGVAVKPYAAAAFFRRDDWLVIAKGFSRYLWDYEGPLEKRQNSFGQNWSYGLLQVINAGNPVSETGSGYDLWNGWDWYHVPGTTATHYAIEQRSHPDVLKALRQAGVRRRDTHRNYNSKTFVGGVTLGDHGFLAQDLEGVPFTSPTDLSARKSYFFVGDKVLALGTHIGGGTASEPTHTTLFQTRVRRGALRGSIDGEDGGTDGKLETRVPAGSQAKLTDSVGNSYFLADSTADLQFTRRVQRSLTPGYEPTSGRFVQAYLDHGVNPDNDSYLYVLIPSDPDERKLEALAADPAAYYRVIASERMHLVHFPEWHITAYAFYETVETEQDQLVRSVNLAAAIITQQRGPEVRLAASVPDLGWQSDDAELHKGLAYGSRHYATQSAESYRLKVVLRGRWELTEPASDISAQAEGNETVLEISCSDGLSRLLTLRPKVNT